MTTVYLSPVFGAGVQVLNNSGVPLAGGKIYIYLAGTTTAINTYTTYSATVLNANPLILDSSGRCPTMIWLPAGLSYKFVVTDSANVPIGYTLDGVAGINDASFPYTYASEWNQAGAPTYISATRFSVSGDQTATFPKYRRVKSTNTGGIAYSTVVSSTYAAGVTTVVVTNDSTPLDAGMALVYYGLINSSPTSLPGNVAVAGIGASGNFNYSIGSLTMPLVSGDSNLAFGYNALHAATTGSFNIGIGTDALKSVTGGSLSNVAIGASSMASSVTATGNVAIGDSAMFNCVSVDHSVAIGQNALQAMVTTDYHVAIGDSALLLALGGTGLVAIGYRAGYGGSSNFSSNSIYIGYQAVQSGTAADNEIVIGANAVGSGANTITLGSSSHTDTVLFGRVKIPQYTTAGAPAYVKGALYFDTTLNKLRVGGASAWETVTSV
jgi:hypothetical protein